MNKNSNTKMDVVKAERFESSNEQDILNTPWFYPV